jgi:hypothetical protein
MDSRHKAGYDGGGAGYDGGEAGHDGGEAGYDGGKAGYDGDEGWLHAVAVAVGTNRLVVGGAACRDG